MVRQANKRKNKTVKLSDVIAKAIDPAMQKRGFANRDIITNWQQIAPAPYNKLTLPEKLVWKKYKINNNQEEKTQGATLFLRCEPSFAMALSYESEAISAAINRYFGYILIDKIKLSLLPFTPHSSKIIDKEIKPTKEMIKQVNDETSKIEDDELKQALRQLGLRIKTNKTS